MAQPTRTTSTPRKIPEGNSNVEPGGTPLLREVQIGCRALVVFKGVRLLCPPQEGGFSPVSSPLCHPDRRGRFFLPFAPRERRPRSGGTGQHLNPTIGDPTSRTAISPLPRHPSERPQNTHRRRRSDEWGTQLESRQGGVMGAPLCGSRRRYRKKFNTLQRKHWTRARRDGRVDRALAWRFFAKLRAANSRPTQSIFMMAAHSSGERPA